MSVAGGISKAVDRAEAHGCEALQIFTKNGNRWQGPPLDPIDVGRFRARLEETAIRPAVCSSRTSARLPRRAASASRIPSAIRRSPSSSVPAVHVPG